MPAPLHRDFQRRPMAGWTRLSRPHFPRVRRGFEVDESMTQDSSWVELWHAPEKSALRLMNSYWGFPDQIRDHLEAWRAPNHGELRSYALSVSESFQIAAREYRTISIDPDIMSGAPCIAGTRIPVYMILDAIGYYGSPEGALESYPNLTLRQVNDAIGFAKIVVECPIADNEP